MGDAMSAIYKGGVHRTQEFSFCPFTSGRTGGAGEARAGYDARHVRPTRASLGLPFASAYARRRRLKRR